jgi:response regulator RpfG family c-di-GMP phosphodiesterase
MGGWRPECKNAFVVRRTKVNQIELSSEPMPPVFLCACSQKSAACATILVVEDETFVRELTCEILQDEGYRVLKARNATEARTAFRRVKGTVRLLLTDVVLPGQDGRDLANDLRAVCPAIRTIFTSG